jgi:hypothetical protein
MSGMGEVLEEILRGVKWLVVGLLIAVAVLLAVIVILIVMLAT